MEGAAENPRHARDLQIRDAVVLKLEASGERERLKAALREHLVACGWFDSLKQHCRDIIRAKGLERITVDQLVAEILPHGKATIPDSVKAALLLRIKAFMQEV